jgi:hypothetical protein
MGIGIIARARNASKEFPQPSPSFSYIFGAARGNTAAMMERVTVIAASPDAAYKVKASIVYA